MSFVVRRGRQALGRSEELPEGRHKIPGREPVQVQQRQHLADLWRLPCPRRQDRRREPLPLARFGVHALVVDPRRGHLHRAGAGEHLARLVAAVAPPAGARSHRARRRTGRYRRRLRPAAPRPASAAHPPGRFRRSIDDDPGADEAAELSRSAESETMVSTGTYLPDQRCTAGLAWNLQSVTREGTPLPEPSTFKHCSRNAGRRVQRHGTPTHVDRLYTKHEIACRTPTGGRRVRATLGGGRSAARCSS